MSDLIDRQAAIEALWKIKDERDSVYYTSAIYTAVDALEQLPSAEPKRGKWEPNKDDSAGCGFFVCSVCGADSYDAWDFCPYCGADMRGEE